jgi:sugar phosphate isomerase/epimerase
MGLKVLGKKIKHVHLKDARPPRKPPAPDHPTALWNPVLVGEGKFPARDLVQILLKKQYAGFVSFEWEKRWHPEIPEPEVALPHFIKWIRAAIKSIQNEDESK